MGATPSKKRKERRRQKETEEVLAAVANLKEVYTKSSFHPYRRSQLLDFHDVSDKPSDYQQGKAPGDLWWQKSASTGAVNLVVPNNKNIVNGSKQRLTFSQVNVDNHPMLSSLQNKQNARLEDMENRLGEIRRHALEAVAAQQRRVQGHSCQGQMCPNQTLQGHNVTNSYSVDQRTAVKAASDGVVCERHSEQPGAINCSDEDNDEGEVIPVRVLTSAESRRAEMRRQRREFSREKSPADPLSLDLLWKGSPLIIALLPIILPVLLLSVIMKAISQSYQDKKKR